MGGSSRRRLVSGFAEHGAAVGSRIARAALPGGAAPRLADRRDQRQGDEPGLHHAAVRRAADGIHLLDSQRLRRAQRSGIRAQRILSARGQRGSGTDRKRHAIRQEHAQRPGGVDRPGVPRLYGYLDDPESRIELQLRLAGGAAAQRSPITQRLDTIMPLAWTLSFLGRLLPYVIVTIVFTFMYWLIPNTRV